MAENTDSMQGGDLIEAIGLMTRLPVHPAGPLRGARAAWAWPLAGALAVGIAALAGGAVALMGATPGVIAGVVLATQVMLTGALHEDGLADTADGLWGGAEKARRLAIMKDSRIGSYGVIALGLSLLIRWSAITTLAAQGWLLTPLMAVALISRAPMAGLMAVMAPARDSGLSASTGRPPMQTVWIGAGIAAALSLLLIGVWASLAAVFWAALAVIAVAITAQRKIGGQTGDILGAAQQLAEIAALAALASLA